jgi:hypothetical protein
MTFWYIYTWNPVQLTPWKWYTAKRNCLQMCLNLWIRLDR